MKIAMLRSLSSLFLILAFLISGIAQRKPSNQASSILITGGTVVSMDGSRRVIEDGAVLIRAEKIAWVGRRSELGNRGRGATVVDASGKAVIPGLINTHTHVPMALFRGIADDMDLQEWLTKFIFPAEAKNVDEAFVRAGTRLGMAEMIRGGTTTYCDMYYFEDAIADETKKAGMRGVLGETILDFPAPDNKTWQSGIAYTERFIKKWQNDPLIVPAVAPHAPYTVSQQHLLEARDLSNRLKAPMLIHLAEANTETEFIQQKHQGKRPIE